MDFLALFLNRSCPRGCRQCGIADCSRTPLQLDQWKEALQILSEAFQVHFFLFLGTEPLMFKSRLVELVRWFSKKDLFYGFYSTSPEPLFSKYRQPLLDAGLDNWSAGIDLLPDKCLDGVTEKKVRESIEGLIWMAERGVQTNIVATVHRKNLMQIPKIVEWTLDVVKNTQTEINFLEWQRDPRFDFFAKAEDIPDLMWAGTEEEKELVRKVCHRVKLYSRVQGKKVQTCDYYLDHAHEHYTKLDCHCAGVTGPSMDCDGSMRLCAYSKGTRCPKWSAFDLKTPGALSRFYGDWEKDLDECPGCHWIVQDSLRGDIRILDPNSGFHEDRWCLTQEDYAKITKDDGF